MDLTDFGIHDPLQARYGDEIDFIPFRFLKRHQMQQEGDKKMANIRESALTYESKTTKNISELKKVSVDLNVQHKKVAGKDGKDDFEYNFVEIEGEEYRVPDSVLKQLKVQLEQNPEIEFFKVVMTGAGMNTAYTVVVVK
jgi:hypothetical protein